MVEPIHKEQQYKSWFKSIKFDGDSVNFKLDSGSDADNLP